MSKKLRGKITALQKQSARRATLQAELDPADILECLAAAEEPIFFGGQDIEDVGLVDGRNLREDGQKLDKLKEGAEPVTPENVAAALAHLQEPLSTNGKTVNGRNMREDGRKLDSVEEGAQQVTTERVLAAFPENLQALLEKDLQEDAARFASLEEALSNLAAAYNVQSESQAQLEAALSTAILRLSNIQDGAQACSTENVLAALTTAGDFSTAGKLNGRDMSADGEKLDKVEDNAQRCSPENLLAALAANSAPLVLNGADLAKVGALNGRYPLSEIDDLKARLAKLEASLAKKS